MKSLHYWEVDVLRGLAVIGMVAYHFYFDLGPTSVLFTHLARTTAIIFLLLVGFSFSFSYDRHRKNQLFFSRHIIFRATKIFLAASAVTLVTYFVSPALTVRFGVLHLISFSLLLLLPFILTHNRVIPALISIVFLLIGFANGLDLADYPTFDFYPILPWFGFILLGYSLAPYYQKFRSTVIPTIPPPVTKPLSFLGRHSLLIYLAHQPIIFGLLFLLKS